MEDEVVVKESDLLVTMTDLRGKITYANGKFCEVANYKLDELVGQPHNTVRHPDVPKAIFKLFWDTLLSGNPINAFVKNSVNGGGYYWVQAFATPIVEDGRTVGLVSYRRGITPSAKKTIAEIYKVLVDYERNHGVQQSYDYLMDYLSVRKLSYNEFLNRINSNREVTNEFLLSLDKNKLYIDHLAASLEVKNRLHSGEVNFEVVKSCCCDFGKFLSSVTDSSVTRNSDWKQMTTAHDAFHNNLQNFANGQNGLEQTLEKNAEEVFEHLQNVIDTVN